MRRVTLLVVFVGAALATVAVRAQSVPVPRPFPGASPSQPAPRPVDPAPSAPGPTAPAPVVPPIPKGDPAPEGTPIYPSAEFLESYDAGSGQRYYLYGTNTSYADIVAYYRNILKNGGRELYRTPATHQFDLGRFQQDAMNYPPSVVVKDYTWNGSPGYLVASGTEEKRFRTVIQIVPASPAAAR